MYSLSFMVHIIPNQGLRFEASKTGEGLLARFEESRIKTERTGDHLGVADEERDGREAPPSKLGGTGWDGQHADDGKMRQGGGRPTATGYCGNYWCL